MSIYDHVFFARRRAIDTDGSNLVTVNEFAGLMRRYRFKKKDGSTPTGKEPLPEYDIAGHAGRIMAMADKMVRNQELNVTELQTFLANTESVLSACPCLRYHHVGRSSDYYDRFSNHRYHEFGAWITKDRQKLQCYLSGFKQADGDKSMTLNRDQLEQCYARFLEYTKVSRKIGRL